MSGVREGTCWSNGRTTQNSSGQFAPFLRPRLPSAFKVVFKSRVQLYGFVPTTHACGWVSPRFPYKPVVARQEANLAQTNAAMASQLGYFQLKMTCPSPLPVDSQPVHMRDVIALGSTYDDPPPPPPLPTSRLELGMLALPPPPPPP